MCVRCLGFVLLAWLPAVLYAQTAELPCSPPELIGGYFVPQQKTYPHGKTLTYSCETEFKPVVEGWWATSTCQNGKWAHTPQCISNRSCLPPTIPNGKYEEAQNGWYEENHMITVNCEDGFELKRRTSTARCSNGRWSPLPLCERSNDACDEPDKIPHAVIINQEPKKLYAHNSRLHYKCEDGYTTGQANYQNYITCNGRSWSPEPSCDPECVLDPTRLNIGRTSRIIMKEGQSMSFDCGHVDYMRVARCSGRRITISQCCHTLAIAQGQCRVAQIQ